MITPIRPTTHHATPTTQGLALKIEDLGHRFYRATPGWLIVTSWDAEIACRSLQVVRRVIGNLSEVAA